MHYEIMCSSVGRISLDGRVVVRFQVSTDQLARSVRSVLSPHAMHGLRERDGQRRAFLGGLVRLEEGLKSGDYNLSSRRSIEIILEDAPAPLQAQDKHCHWQSSGASGLECLASSEPTKETTRFACGECEVADDAWRCSYFVHPHTITITGAKPDSNLLIRRIDSNLCERGLFHEMGALCQPFGSKRENRFECWTRLVSVDDPQPVPSDIGDRVVDEIDFFALVYNLHHADVPRVWPVRQTRTIHALVSACANARGFFTNAAVLADLLHQLPVPKAFPVEGEKNLKSFEDFIAHDYPTARADASRLRELADLRNNWPIHSQVTRVTRSFENLGMRYPPEGGWDVAWQRVLTEFFYSLRSLRRAMQDS